MLATLNFVAEPPKFTRSQSLNIPNVLLYKTTSDKVHRELETINEENWHEVLLTPENIKSIKKPLSPPKRVDKVYGSLQDFLLNGQQTTQTTGKPLVSETQELSAKTVVNSTSTSPPPKSISPEKSRWAGPAFCNSPAPQNLPKPSFYSDSPAQLSKKQLSASCSNLTSKTSEDLSPSKKLEAQLPKQSPPKKSTMKSREEIHQISPTKKKTTYVPKSKPSSVAPSSPPSLPQAQNVQLEELSNQLKQMLNVKTG